MATLSYKPTPGNNVSPSESLSSFRDNPRTLFLPTTAFELKLGSALLSVYDDSEGTHTALIAFRKMVAGSAYKRTHDSEVARKSGDDAAKSTLHNYGDFLANAVQSHADIRGLRYFVDDAKPQLTLQSVLENAERGQRHGSVAALLAPVVRYMALDQMASHGKRGKFDPLFTNKNRNKPELWRPGAHKRIEDVFTGHDKRKTQKLVGQFLMTSSVRDVQRIVPHSQLDQEMRAKFWFGELSKVQAEYRRLAQFIIKDSLPRKV